MRKLILVVVALAVCTALVWAMGRAVVGSVVSDEVDRPWPLGLGTLHGVPARYPSTAENSTATELRTAPLPLGLDDALTQYRDAQIAKTAGPVDAPPEVIRKYAGGDSVAVARVRDLLLNGEPPIFATDIRHRRQWLTPPSVELARVHRFLIADALARAASDPAVSWDDLHAAWRLSVALMQRPETRAFNLGIAMARDVIAIARFLPAPAPQWFEEAARFDYRRAALAAAQAQSWMVSEDILVGRDRTLRYFRTSAETLAASRRCDAGPQAERSAPNPRVATIWTLPLRLVPEVELTQRVLRMKAGLPPEPSSACQGGSWVYVGQTIRFRGNVQPVRRPQREIPLLFTVEPTPARTSRRST